MGRSRAFPIALAAIMIAVTWAFTSVLRIPIAATGGYFNFSDVAINFIAFAFGPWIGLVAGGVGTAVADVTGGYPQWAFVSLLAHGLEGLVAGALGRDKAWLGLTVAWLAGAVIMVGIYFQVQGLVSGWGAALVELPWNLLQALAGAVVGIPLVYAVRKAYPPITQMGKGPEWRED